MSGKVKYILDNLGKGNYQGKELKTVNPRSNEDQNFLLTTNFNKIFNYPLYSIFQDNLRMPISNESLILIDTSNDIYKKIQNILEKLFCDQTSFNINSQLYTNKNSPYNEMLSSILTKDEVAQKEKYVIPEIIDSFQGLLDHLRDPNKNGKYNQIADELGLDVDFFEKQRSKPKIVMAEQAGPWLYSSYRFRNQLVNKVVDRLNKENIGIDNDKSGALTLFNDPIVTSGEKAVFNGFSFIEVLNQIPFLTSGFIKKNLHKLPYGDIVVSSASSNEKINKDILKHSIDSVYDFVIMFLEIANKDKNKLTDETIAKIYNLIHDKDLKHAISKKSFISGDLSKNKIREIIKSLTDVDIDEAIKFIKEAKNHLTNHNDKNDLTWGDYWTKVNSIFIENKINKVDKLFNEFILAIKDIKKLVFGLSSLMKQDLKKYPNVSLFSITTLKGKMQTVKYDTINNELFYITKKQKQVISFDEIKKLAKEGSTGGPTVVLEYIMMCLSSIYIFPESDECLTQDWEKNLVKFHQERIGLPFPIVKVETCFESKAFIDTYRNSFREDCLKIIEGFVNS